ncbi:hypothetical protein CAOG_04250 [Capsaspora owczarzaki ATCC 30864]|uniref:G-protein coupled receptors family 2 profile 2 domain-containing protein n=1 Tax=Capsaspora owczarzaki (strain ATCC 30864) TaxID=595528 RepID=A0A0D2VRG9_CAPO3|nr:hypothetical protein CAOG_04250 [Capsaspora owczarzaki ATCC 30864]KJE93462.1 hypothetical protein CAOG_004250 [Capsaspora owczarzaki ATCC 30864]|eukprot:XP_004348075.1 hypothetical protein CAOG_04250 [Capsaspora owczarzaki ATCC 30864]
MPDKTVDFNLDESPFAAEWGLYGVALVNFLVNFTVACYLVYWRNWAPIRAKQLDFLLLSSASGWIWLIGAMSATRTIPQVGAMLSCNFWAFWVQFCFGALMWCACIILRMYRLYVIMIATKMRMNVSNPRAWMYGRLVMVCSPVILFCIIATATNAVPIVPQPTSAGVYVDLCSMEWWALYSLMVFCIVYLLLVVWLMVQLRRIRKFLNEFRETKIAFWCVVISGVFYAVIHVMAWQKKVWGRVLCVAMILVMVNVSYWLILGPTVIGRWFNPEAFLAKFHADKDYQPNSTTKKENSSTKHNMSINPLAKASSRKSEGQSDRTEESEHNQSEFEVRMTENEFSVVPAGEIAGNEDGPEEA